MKITRTYLNHVLLSLPNPWVAINNPNIPRTFRVPVYDINERISPEPPFLDTRKIQELTFKLDLHYQDWIIEMPD